MTDARPETDELLRSAGSGDDAAWHRLVDRHGPRLRQMVAAHLDRRLSSRVDPSDVVQETLADAARHLADYLRDRPLPFYPWLRQLARQRLQAIRRRHLDADRRSVLREAPTLVGLPDQSAAALADLLLAGGTSPSQGLIREEQRRRVRDALDRLPANDRELLVMRHLEAMPAAEIAAALGITEGAARTRHVRALARLRDLLVDDDPEDLP